MDLPAAQVTALRGKRTLQSLGCRAKDSIQLGDPGLLAGLLTEKKPSRYKLGIIPHWSEFLQPALAPLVAMSPEILLIDPCAGAREVLDNICRCEHILSSSLHGLIVADALGIPNAWLRLNLGYEDQAGMGEFKYRDYYSIFGLDQIAFLTPEEATGLDAILDPMASYHPGQAWKRQRPPFSPVFPSLSTDPFSTADAGSIPFATVPGWYQLGGTADFSADRVPSSTTTSESRRCCLQQEDQKDRPNSANKRTKGDTKEQRQNKRDTQLSSTDASGFWAITCCRPNCDCTSGRIMAAEILGAGTRFYRTVESFGKDHAGARDVCSAS